MIRLPLDLFRSLFAHLKITCCDLLGLPGGLSSAPGLEHYVVRAVEFRVLEYLAARGAYLVDNLMILALVLGLPMFTDYFIEMLKGDVEALIPAMTGVILFSIGLRILLTVLHARLFPGMQK